MSKPRKPRDAQILGVSKRKAYSQNILRDSQAVKRFVAALPTDDGRLAVEIGAGDGFLTVALAEHFSRVKAYEIDPDMVHRLKRRGIPGNVEIVCGDFLEAPSPRTPFHVAANIPFGLTSQIVSWCLTAPHLETATLITESAYARKRTGDYGKWSLLTVRTWPWFEWTYHGKIMRRAFRPIPSVDAGILGLRRRPRPLIQPSQKRRWEEFVERGFSGIGGSLFKSLKPLIGRHSSRCFSQASISRDAVVAFVHPDDWVTLFECHENARLG